MVKLVVNKNDNDGAFKLNELNQSNKSKTAQKKAVCPERGCGCSKPRKLVASREDAVHLRENAEDLREDAADIREDSILLREENASSREQEIHAAEKIQVAFDEHIIKLQQANAHLVVATMKAHKLAEEVEETHIQMVSAKVVAEKASLAKSVFLNNMSHELRTPLSRPWFWRSCWRQVHHHLQIFKLKGYNILSKQDGICWN